MSTEKKLTAVEWLVRQMFSTQVKYTVEEIIEQAKELEKQQIKNKCVEFSKYIRNGKDHFNNGYSTEMVYDEFIKN